MIYKKIIRPLLFLINPEKVHGLAALWLKLIFSIPGLKNTFRNKFSIKDKALEREVFGLRFPNPVGLAAGYDKSGNMIDLFDAFGFGFIEIGTVTPLAQPGNPQPRLFRLPKDHALINRMGFNNLGVELAVKNLKRRKSSILIGGNIGKNKTTPNENAIDDYVEAFLHLQPFVDYFVVNVSSPNTPDLRSLQDKEPLTRILSRLQQLNVGEGKKPLLLKIAPDLSDAQLDDIAEIILQTQLDGLIATNTTISRENLNTSIDEIEGIGPGGLSGEPLKERATEVIRYMSTKVKNIPIIGVGGIMTGEDAIEKLKAGASLVQVYTGFIYEGPGFVKKINEKILEHAQFIGG